MNLTVGYQYQVSGPSIWLASPTRVSSRWSSSKISSFRQILVKLTVLLEKMGWQPSSGMRGGIWGGVIVRIPLRCRIDRRATRGGECETLRNLADPATSWSTGRAGSDDNCETSTLIERTRMPTASEICSDLEDFESLSSGTREAGVLFSDRDTRGDALTGDEADVTTKE